MEILTKAKSEKIVSLLNDITEINNGRIQGYERAISQTNDEDLIYLFVNMAANSRTFKRDLHKEIYLLGGEPKENNKNTGKLFQAWIDINAALTEKNKKEILRSCEFAEDVILDTYKDILENKDYMFSENLINLIKMQKREIQIAHARIKALKDLGKNL